MASNTDTISIGSVVQLKSGGPRMVVDKVKNGRADCLWQARDSFGHWRRYDLYNLNIEILENAPSIYGITD
jgi:uncharacterized protein YodC (DUF2158 family)